jgi:error-prone DNA polymerase
MTGYVELHAHSFYSLLDGVPSPEQLIQRAVEYEMPALALTDHDALYGAARFDQAARAASIKPIFGAEITLVNGGGHLTLLAETDQGYANLCRLITLARRDQQKGFAALPWRLLANHHDGLIALSGCRRSEIAHAALERNQKKAQQVVERFVAIFGRNNIFLELQRHHERHDRRLNLGLVDLAHRNKLRVVATGNVHYVAPDDAPLHDVLTCIRHRVPLERANGLLRTNAEYYFHSPQEMTALFAEWPDALQATFDIAERCNVRLPLGPQGLPAIAAPHGMSAGEYLRHLCEDGLSRKIKPSSAVRSQSSFLTDYRTALDRELHVIEEQSLTNYFLIVHDLIRFARSQNILCQGRGSAANSLVAYLLDITPIDPIAGGLVFERFLSAERATAPDIDVDFAADRREEAIQYLYQKYGPDHAAMACTVVTFGGRQAIRDVGMALGFSTEIIDQVSGNLDTHFAADLTTLPNLRSVIPEAQLASPRWQQWLSLATAIEGFPRHLGIHNGGVIISGPSLIEQIPVEPASMEDRFVVQWDKDSLEMAGWVKLDVLGLRMLSAISDAVDIVEQQTGQRPDLNALRFDDSHVYDMICRGETVGVFQVESRAQASLIPRFQPRSFADLTVEIALIRPGPVQGNMVHPFLNRRDRLEPVRYLHVLLKPALEETLGVILFQEQVLKVARDLAGFTAGEGELLRRALSHKRAADQIETFRAKFIAGAQSRGVSPKIAEQVFAQLKAFGGYSFSKAHSAAFAVITYWSAWLRCYHPTAFFAGLLRHQPMGFYPKHVVVNDAMRVGVKFLPIDLRHSQAQVTVEGEAIRLSLGDVYGFGPEQIDLIETERQRGSFRSLNDLVKRTGLDRPHVEALVLSGALDYLGERRQLLWDIAEAFRLAKRPRELPLRSIDEQVSLAPMDQATRLSTVFALTGTSLEAHLTELRRDTFTKAGATPINELPHLKHGQSVKIGGLIVARQHPPTAKGFAFLAIEDPGGMVNVVIAPDIYTRDRAALQGAFVVIDGVLQKDHRAINVIARQMIAL